MEESGEEDFRALEKRFWYLAERCFRISGKEFRCRALGILGVAENKQFSRVSVERKKLFLFFFLTTALLLFDSSESCSLLS